MIGLHGALQQYAWGKVGESSFVAQLSKAGNTDVSIDSDQTYAELWMGTHAKGPSALKANGSPLSQYLLEHHEICGSKLGPWVQSNRGQLPFLFKILSVNKALSIQSHPTKDQAKILHDDDPQHYPDANHKPEMAIALTPFEMMCGFRQADQILEYIQSVTELAALVSPGAVAELKSAVDNKLPSGDPQVKNAIKACFGSLLGQPDDVMRVKLDTMLERLTGIVGASQVNAAPNFDTDNCPGFVSSLVLRLGHEFPGDIGCFAPFFLNWFRLKPGEASFLGPNEPHAYLFGDCVECMACSDNTIRAGLTPKFKDIDTLLNSLTYRTGSVAENKFVPTPLTGNPFVMVYNPPVEDFGVMKIEISEPQKMEMPIIDSCAIMLIVSGEAQVEYGHKNDKNDVTDLNKGSIVLVSANLNCSLSVTKSPFVAFVSYAQL